MTPSRCGSPSASCTTTATCRSDPSWSSSSPTTGHSADRAARAALVERDDGQPFDRRTIHRYVERVAKRAGVGHVHPHQLRHTLATRLINRGMSLEAIAALSGTAPCA